MTDDQLRREIILYNYIFDFAFRLITTNAGPNKQGLSNKIEAWLNNHKQEAFAWVQENNIDVETEEGQMAFRLRFS